MWAGELLAYVFENVNAGVAAAMYWSLYLRSDSDERVIVDFFSLDVSDCISFAQASTTIDGTDELAAVSYYDDGHCPAGSCDLTLTRESGQRFTARVSLRDVVGGEHDEFEVEADVVFSGFVVREESLNRPVVDEGTARSILARFLEPSRLTLVREKPYVFMPAAPN